MIDGTVCFIDSGIGGLPIAQHFISRNPDVPVSYIADSANFPYGVLDEDGVCNAVLNTAKKLLEKGRPRVIVVACNTASVQALEQLRNLVPCPVVGTVPALKTAAEQTEGPIGILSTDGTATSSYLQQLIRNFAPDRDVIVMGAGGIVRHVEFDWPGEGRIREELERVLGTFKRIPVSSLVIGCTHFLFVQDLIRSTLGNQTELFDPCNGISNRIDDLLNWEENPVESSGNPRSFYTTLASSDTTRISRLRDMADRFDFRWKGRLE